MVATVPVADRRDPLMLLPDGRVLSTGRTGAPQVWDPATGNFKSVPAPANLFCAGHALLADGRVFVAGGHIKDGFGLPNITLFSSDDDTLDFGHSDGQWPLVSDDHGHGQRRRGDHSGHGSGQRGGHAYRRCGATARSAS